MPAFAKSSTRTFLTKKQMHERKVANDVRMRKLLIQYRNQIIAELPPKSSIEDLACKGEMSTCVHVTYPPMKTEGLVDGVEAKVPVHESDVTHFGGWKGVEAEKADPTDHSEKAVRRVGLLQGFPSEHSKHDPSTLPGGQTVIDLLNEWCLGLVKDPKDAMFFQTVFRAYERGEKVCRLEVHLIWDADRWDEWQSEAKSRHSERARERATPQKTLTEYEAEMDSKRVARAAPPPRTIDDEGFEVVGKKRRK